MAHTPSSILYSIIGILLSGLAGGIAGWSIIGALGWSGVGGALAAAVIGMVVATAVWVALTVLARKAGLAR